MSEKMVTPKGKRNYRLGRSGSLSPKHTPNVRRLFGPCERGLLFSAVSFLALAVLVLVGSRPLSLVKRARLLRRNGEKEDVGKSTKLVSQ